MFPLYQKHEFWDTQPVPKIKQKDSFESGPYEVKEVKDISKQPQKLPEGFEWACLNLKDKAQLQELYELLNNNYVEDKEHTFRLDYRPELIEWILLIPGYR